LKKLLKNLFAGAALLVSAFVAPMASGATFVYDAQQQAIIMDGEINPGDFSLFLGTVTKHIDETKYIIVTSPGGDFISSLLIGQYVHVAGINTVASGECYWGCAFIWLGGKRKLIDIDTDDYVGIHMPYLTTWAGFIVQADDHEKKIVEDYLKDMGLPKRAIEEIKATPGGPTTVLYITTARAESWGVTVLPYGR